MRPWVHDMMQSVMYGKVEVEPATTLEAVATDDGEEVLPQAEFFEPEDPKDESAEADAVQMPA